MAGMSSPELCTRWRRRANSWPRMTPASLNCTLFETALNLPTFGKSMAQRCREFSRIPRFWQKWPNFAALGKVIKSIC